MKKILILFAFIALAANGKLMAQEKTKSKTKTVTSAQPATKKLTEEQKIAHLIKYVAGLDGATFIRNGDSYAAKDAAEHLQMKRRKAGSRVTTAREFIDGLASESYISGKPYQIKMKDGKVYSSRDVLMKELSRIEKL
jgi:hypothetical protein